MAIRGELHWDDAHSPPATEAVHADKLDEVHCSLPIITRGWVLRDDDIGVTMGGEWVGGNEYRNVTFVPRSLVRKLVTNQRKKKLPAPPSDVVD